MNQIILVGTSHKYQIYDDGKKYVAQFENVLSSLCASYKAFAIAEEMNQSALEKNGGSRTIANVVAAKLGLKHQLSDPLPNMREQLGIRQENDIRAFGFVNNWSPEVVEEEIRKSIRIREEYWLHQLIDLNSWPLLFVCGADHCDSFSKLLSSAGFRVSIPIADWAPL